MSISRGTVHSVQFLRFAAATLVLLFHAHHAVSASTDTAAEARANWFGFGASGVHIFFVISGYIMYLTNFGRDAPFRPVSFLLRRLSRIYPIYWLFVLLYVAAHTMFGDSYRIEVERVPGMLLLWPGDAPLVIGPAWTLSFELYFYAVFGLVMIAGARRGIVALTLIFAASVAAGMILRPASPSAALATSTLLLEFVAGAWIARVTLARRCPRTMGWVAVMLALFGFAAGIAYGYHRLPSAMVWGLPSILLVLGFVILESSGGVPGTRRLSVLGDSSYVLYLSHILLIDLYVAGLAALGVSQPWPPALAGGTLLCIAAAHAFHLAVERPMVRTLHRWMQPGQRSRAKTAA